MTDVPRWADALGAEESLRWCFRHQAGLSWDRVEDEDIITLSFEARPEGNLVTLSVCCRDHDHADELVGELVAEARCRYNLE